MAQTPDFVPALYRIHYVPLECGFNPIKADSVMAAPHQRNIFRVRPAKRHRRTGWASTFHPLHPVALQVAGVPQLFTDHATPVCEFFHCGNERLGITSGSQFVVTAFSRQNWPATTHARAVESAAIVFLTIAIVIVATPSRALRKVVFDHAVNHLERVPHNRVVGAANSESDKVKKISSDDISRRMKAAAIGDLDHGCVRVRMGIRSRGIGRIDSNVMARKTRNQFAFRCDCPFFKMRNQPISVNQDEISQLNFLPFPGAFRRADESGDNSGQS